MTAKKSTTPLTALAFGAMLLTAAPARAQNTEAEKKPEASQEKAPEKETAAEGADTQETPDKEDERNKRLADRIKAVQRKVFLKRERIEVFPYFGIDLNDAFFQHLLIGASVAYHFVDSAAVEVRGGVGVVHLKQSALRIARQQAGIVLDNPPEFKYHADIDFSWAPFYGKISLLGEGILHFDTYLTAGPGIFGTDAGVNPALNVGIGQRYFITKWLVARVEIRDYVFIDKRNDRSDLQSLMVLGFSVSGFFPTSFEYDFQ